MLKTKNNKYDPVTKKDDPVLSICMPGKILRDLVLRSEENGHTVELELALRLARSLERDLEMIAKDNDAALAAFNLINQVQE